MDAYLYNRNNYIVYLFLSLLLCMFLSMLIIIMVYLVGDDQAAYIIIVNFSIKDKGIRDK